MNAIRLLYHPATGQLLRSQTRAKFQQVARTLKQPRRRFLAILALTLGLIWFSQAVATIFLRQSADPEHLRNWLPLGLAMYAGWHLVKLVTRTPEEPFDWSPAEREWVLAAPLTRTQQITYRLMSILSAAVAKAICFSLLMIPDLPYPWIAWIGFLGGLLFVDLVRLTVELIYHGLTGRDRWLARSVVLSSVIGVMLAMAYRCWFSPTAVADLSSPGALGFFQRMLSTLMEFADTGYGQTALFPFRMFTDTVLMEAWSLTGAGRAIGALLVLVGMIRLVYLLDEWATGCRRHEEQKQLAAAINQRHQSDITVERTGRRVIVPWRLAGAGSLMWRQLLGAVHYRGTILFSLTVPVVLSCLPLLADHDPFTMLCHLVGGALFYSFLLLPAALMLDFRRDIQRMTVLKSLPISPLAVTIGQLGTPVLICWIFQAVVLVIALIAGRIVPGHAIGAWALLLPANLLIFAVENYIFLLSPYQRDREGFDVFLRTILTFTGKGVLFAVGLALILAWASLAIVIVRGLGLSSPIAALIFGAGIWLIGLSLATLFVAGTTRKFAQFDPSQDVPGQS